MITTQNNLIAQYSPALNIFCRNVDVAGLGGVPPLYIFVKQKTLVNAVI
jgi:hypothetical protein